MTLVVPAQSSGNGRQVGIVDGPAVQSAAFFSASSETSSVASWRVIARSRIRGDMVLEFGAAVR